MWVSTISIALTFTYNIALSIIFLLFIIFDTLVFHLCILSFTKTLFKVSRILYFGYVEGIGDVFLCEILVNVFALGSLHILLVLVFEEGQRCLCHLLYERLLFRLIHYRTERRYTQSFHCICLWHKCVSKCILCQRRRPRWIQRFTVLILMPISIRLIFFLQFDIIHTF